MSDAPAPASPCPCQSGRAYSQCCQPAIDQQRPPATAEALMRSRYTAFFLNRAEYLQATVHSSQASAFDAAQLAQQNAQTHWVGLEIISSQGGAEDDTGEVHFKARFIEQERLGTLEERSRFLREEGRWVYQDGETHVELSAEKIGRNSPCPCGSGKKFKRCCSS